MKTYLALLRGVNVGGKTMVKMADLKEALLKAGLKDVQTYIQSGNVIFKSDAKDMKKLARLIEATIGETFKLQVGVVVFSAAEWKEIINSKPEWWGEDPAWKHNLLIMMDRTETKDVLPTIDELKPGIEKMQEGKGIIYQSLLFQKFGQTSATKLVGTPIYKRMTIRNYNTANKLLSLLD
jgi:uncharacterized protein (DUF1697 family)